MKLTEVLNSPVAIHWMMVGAAGAKARFEVNGHKYVVWIDRDRDEQTEEGAWEIVFFLEDKASDEIRMDTTGTGGQFQVYSTVFSILLEHMKKNGTLAVKMVAEDPSRLSLYPKLLAKFLRGWSVSVDGENIIARPPH